MKDYDELRKEHIELYRKAAQTQLFNEALRRQFYKEILSFLQNVRDFLIYEILIGQKLEDIFKWQRFWRDWLLKHPRIPFIERKIN